MNNRNKILTFCFSLIGVSMLILIAIFVLQEKSLPNEGVGQNVDTSEKDKGSPKIEKESGSPDEKGKPPHPRGRNLNLNPGKSSEDIKYPSVFPTIDELLSYGPRFLDEFDVPEWKFNPQTLSSSLNSTITDEFKVQPTCITLLKIVNEITHSTPKESFLTEFLLLTDELDDKGEPAKDPSSPALAHISYVRHLRNFIKFHLELLKFTENLSVSDFIHERLLKCPLKITNLEFISLLDNLSSPSSPQSLHTLLDRFVEVSLSARSLKIHLREHKNSQFTFYSFVGYKALSFRALIFLHQAKAPTALQSDYRLLVKSGFAHEQAIKFVDAFYSHNPLPQDDSIFYLLDDLYVRTLHIEVAVADEREFRWYLVTKPLPYHDYKRHLGFKQISLQLPKFEKYMDSKGWLHPGNLLRRLFPDPTSQISPLEAFDSFFRDYRYDLFGREKFPRAFDNYMEGFNYYKNDNDINDINVLGRVHRKITLTVFHIQRYIFVLNSLHPELKEDLKNRVFYIMTLPFSKTDDDLLARLVSLWDMIGLLGKTESLSIRNDLFDSLNKFYASNIDYELFHVNIMGKETPQKQKYQKFWDNVWLPFQDLDWSTKISKLRMQTNRPLL